MLLRIGETIDRYRIEALIGQGGMAAVYRVRHVRLDSEHALKVLFVTSPKLCDRLIREGRVQANLHNSNIVSVTDVLNIQGSPALVMEYIDGPALDTWLLENRPTLEESLWLFRGILRGMTIAHERGVVHRDLKPANVLLFPSDEGLVPKVTDFGLVKSLVDQKGDTMTGMSLGTPEYMSPEQIRDASDIDARADMWALGCILYELVCHKRAFQGVDKMGTFNLIVAGHYEPPRKLAENLPRNVAEAIRSLLEVDREERLASCDALYDLLYEDRESKVGRIAAPPRPIQPLRLDPPSVEASHLPVVPAQLMVATGAPAGRRMATPPSQHRPTARLTLPVLPSLLKLGVTVAAVASTIALVGGFTAVSRDLPESVVASATGPAPSLDRVVRKSEPVALPLSPPFLPPEWETAAAPEPKRPRKAAVEVPPVEAEPVKVEPSGQGRVMIVGDAVSVRLVVGDQQFDPEGPVASGSYRVLADFGDGALVESGTLNVEADAQLTLSCSSSLVKCRSL